MNRTLDPKPSYTLDHDPRVSSSRSRGSLPLNGKRERRGVVRMWSDAYKRAMSDVSYSTIQNYGVQLSHGERLLDRGLRQVGFRD